MTIEPYSSYGLAKAALGTGTAVVHLTDTVIGRVMARRDVRKHEERALRVVLETRVRAVYIDEQALLTETAMDRIVHMSEKYVACLERSSPSAAAGVAQALAMAVDNVLRAASLPDVTRF
jgi:hypothetical protein